MVVKQIVLLVKGDEIEGQCKNYTGLSYCSRHQQSRTRFYPLWAVKPSEVAELRIWDESGSAFAIGLNLVCKRSEYLLDC